MAKIKQTSCIIYIVRHGQTDWNAQGLVQGHSDIPLNKVGEQQARNLSRKLRDIKFDAIYASDLVRAKKTAEIISLERKLTIQTTKLLRERRYGQYDGKPREDIKKFHQIWEKLSRIERQTFRPYTGYDTDEEAVDRFITLLREIAVLYLNKTVLVVSHAGIMRALLNHLSEQTFLAGTISNSGYIKLKSDGVDFFVEELVGIKNPNE